MRLSLCHVSKAIKGVEVLHDLNYTFLSGKIYGIQGKNGSGKTMLLRAAAGLIRPTSGYVETDEYRLTRQHPYVRDLGIMIETPSFIERETGRQNMLDLASIRNVISCERIDETLEQVGLNPTDKRRVRSYSLGMRQRLGIAIALMEHPKVILLDEPINALDPSGVNRVVDALCSERKKGALIVVACHDSEELESVFDEKLYMREGELCKA